MVRNYQRTYRHVRNGKNYMPYLNYSEEMLKKAVADVQAKILTIREARDKYNVPRSTIARHIKEKTRPTQKHIGHPTLFNEEEEAAFVKFCLMLSSWGFPLDQYDLRKFAQRYLNKSGRRIYTLKDNFPGYDWAQNFLRRHSDQLSNRFAANISTDRAKITASTIESFFENYSQRVDGVSPKNIINYDETNLCDDPGAKKYIFKRGTKYPERLINSSKTAVSVMFSGTADGQLLDIYVVYKAENLWDTWTEGGPPGTRYNRSKSGWFDGVTFEDWFETVIIPYAKKTPGRKVIVGDNLSSHFSQKVLDECEKYEIDFVCLPAKTTHLLQPLDVAFYAPLNRYWRTILTKWKETEGKKHKTMVKTAFPRLLLNLYNMMNDKDVISTNLKAGFEKSGLYPINPARPISRLPQPQTTAETVNNIASDVVLEMLQDLRGFKDAESGARKRRKLCEVQPGQSITAKDLNPRDQKATKGKGFGKKTKLANKENDNPSMPNLSENVPSSSTVSVNNSDKSITKNKKIQKKQKEKAKKIPKRSKERRLSDGSSTSVTDEMSVHSDSSIIDVTMFDDDFDDDSPAISENSVEITNISDPKPSTSNYLQSHNAFTSSNLNELETNDVVIHDASCLMPSSSVSCVNDAGQITPRGQKTKGKGVGKKTKPANKRNNNPSLPNLSEDFSSSPSLPVNNNDTSITKSKILQKKEKAKKIKKRTTNAKDYSLKNIDLMDLGVSSSQLLATFQQNRRKTKKRKLSHGSSASVNDETSVHSYSSLTDMTEFDDDYQDLTISNILMETRKDDASLAVSENSTAIPNISNPKPSSPNYLQSQSASTSSNLNELETSGVVMHDAPCLMTSSSHSSVIDVGPPTIGNQVHARKSVLDGCPPSIEDQIPAPESNSETAPAASDSAHDACPPSIEDEMSAPKSVTDLEQATSDSAYDGCLLTIGDQMPAFGSVSNPSPATSASAHDGCPSSNEDQMPAPKSVNGGCLLTIGDQMPASQSVSNPTPTTSASANDACPSSYEDQMPAPKSVNDGCLLTIGDQMPASESVSQPTPATSASANDACPSTNEDQMPALKSVNDGCLLTIGDQIPASRSVSNPTPATSASAHDAACPSSNDPAPATFDSVHDSCSLTIGTADYAVDDTVLVRYYNKKWKYYIGMITACNDDKTYNISFYVKNNNKGQLKFKKPKRIDRDTVQEVSLVKKIEIIRSSDKPEQYVLRDQADTIYF